MQDDFNPYETNGGTVIALAGDDFVVIAGDTRLSSDFAIPSRNQNKLFRLHSRLVMGSCGSWNDVIGLTSVVQQQMAEYEFLHRKRISTEATAQMLSVIMYAKRFFPYFTFNIVAGLDKEGKGAIYSFDPVGHYDRYQYIAGGSSGPLMQPVLDSLIGMTNMAKSSHEADPLTEELAVDLAIDCFVSATERDIFTGDNVIVQTISDEGIAERKVKLRQD